MLKQGDGSVDDPFEIALRCDGREVEAVDGSGPVPPGDQFGEVDRATPVVRASGGERRSALQTGFRRGLGVPEVDGERHQHPQGVGVAAVRRGAAPYVRPDARGLLGRGGPYEYDIGVACGGLLARSARPVDQGDRVALRGLGTMAGPRTVNVAPSKST